MGGEARRTNGEPATSQASKQKKTATRERDRGNSRSSVRLRLRLRLQRGRGSGGGVSSFFNFRTYVLGPTVPHSSPPFRRFSAKRTLHPAPPRPARVLVTLSSFSRLGTKIVAALVSDTAPPSPMPIEKRFYSYFLFSLRQFSFLRIVLLYYYVLSSSSSSYRDSIVFLHAHFSLLFFFNFFFFAFPISICQRIIFRANCFERRLQLSRVAALLVGQVRVRV